VESQALEQEQKVLTGLLDTCYTVSTDIAMREGQLLKFDEEIRKYKQRELVANRQVASYKELRQRWVQNRSHIRIQSFSQAVLIDSVAIIHLYEHKTWRET
jgi:hypothetical protein